MAGPAKEHIFGVAWHRIKEIAVVVDQRDFCGWHRIKEIVCGWSCGGNVCSAGKSELGRNRSLVAWESDLSDAGRNRLVGIVSRR